MEHGKRIDWIKPYTQISDVSYDAADLHIKWFADGSLNAAANRLDRHLAERGDQTVIIWEGDEPDQHRHITYKELHEDVCKFANVLKANGAKNDRITLYMPMIPEAAVAMQHVCALVRCIQWYLADFRLTRWLAAFKTATRPWSSPPMRASVVAGQSRSRQIQTQL